MKKKKILTIEDDSTISFDLCVNRELNRIQDEEGGDIVDIKFSVNNVWMYAMIIYEVY